MTPHVHGVAHVDVEQGVVVDHVVEGRIDPFGLHLAPRGVGASLEAALHPLLERFEAVHLVAAHVPLCCGARRHDVGLVARVGEDAVDALVGPDVLAQRSDSVVAEHRRIEGVAAPVRRGSCVCRLAVVGHVQLLDGDRMERAQVAVGRMHHHRQVDVVEGAAADHELLAAAALFGGRAQDGDPSPEGLGDLRHGDARAEPRGADDVVPARMADAGERVIFAEHCHRRAVFGADAGVERGRDVVGATRHVDAVVFQHAGQGFVGVVLLEVELGVGVNRVREIEQRRREALDLGTNDVFRVCSVHASEVTPPQLRPSAQPLTWPAGTANGPRRGSGSAACSG